MKKYVILLLFLISSSLHAQAPSSTWARLIKDLAFGGAVATDAAGNIFYSGYFYQNITIGSTVLSTRGAADIFLAKFDPQGNPLWARSAGGSGYDVPRCVVVDAAGNCYLAGSFNGTATFGLISITSAGSTDGFLAKYDAAGECVWAVKFGGRYEDGIGGVAVDGNGNSYLSGSFKDAFILGTGQLIASSGGSDFFVVKFDANGTCLWVTQGGGTGDDFGSTISVDALGNTYVAGNFNGSMRIGTDALASSGMEMFVAKFDSMGKPLWARQAQGQAASARSISTDPSGNSTIAGNITGTATFGTIQAANSGGTNAFIARYDAKGTCLWASASGGTHYGVQTSDGKTDARGNAFITGVYTGKATFGGNEISSLNNLTYDIFVCKYDSLGKCSWVISVGGPSLEYAGGIAVGATGTVYVTGTIGDGGTFGRNTLTGTGAFIAAFYDGVLGVDDHGMNQSELPSSFTLEQNYPNPFNPSTTISFSVPSRTFVSLKVYDVLGKEVATLLNEELPAGSHSRMWNATAMPSGVYFYRLQAGSYTETKRLVLLY